MKNLWKIGLILLILVGCASNKSPAGNQEATSFSASEDPYGISNMSNINVEEFSTLYKTTAFALAAANIFVYKKKKISDAMTDYFENYTLTWISLGMLLCAIFSSVAADTDIYYEATFAGMSLIITPYYLFNQYQSASPKAMTKFLWLRALMLAVIDLLIIWFIPKSLVLLIIMAQNLCLMLGESHQFKKLSIQN